MTVWSLFWVLIFYLLCWLRLSYKASSPSNASWCLIYMSTRRTNLLGCVEFAKHPVACLTLASFLATNTGDVARRHIKDPELLRFIDIECYCWSTVLADETPMINSGMVFCDRHYGGINYPIGGVGKIPESLADGLREAGSHLVYKANVSAPILQNDCNSII